MGKTKFTLEYALGHAAPSRLWNYLQTSSGLGEWFADSVEQDGKQYTFSWGDAVQQAALVSMRRDVYVRFHWNDDPERTYFEMRLSRSELTDETTLTVTDHAEDSDDQDELTDLWNQQVDSLKRILGIN